MQQAKLCSFACHPTCRWPEAAQALASVWNHHLSILTPLSQLRLLCDDRRHHFSPDLFKIPANKIQRWMILYWNAGSWNWFQAKIWIWNLIMINININIYYLLFRWICWLDTKIKAHNFPCSTLIQNYIFRSNIAMDHLHTAMQKWQAFRNLLI